MKTAVAATESSCMAAAPPPQAKTPRPGHTACLALTAQEGSGQDHAPEAAAPGGFVIPTSNRAVLQRE